MMTMVMTVTMMEFQKQVLSNWRVGKGKHGKTECMFIFPLSHYHDDLMIGERDAENHDKFNDTDEYGDDDTNDDIHS